MIFQRVKKNQKWKKKRTSGGWIFEELTFSSERQTQENDARRKTKKAEEVEVQFFKKNPMYPRDRKKLSEKKIAWNNSKMILKNFDFDLKNYIDIDLLFNLNSTSEDEIDRIIEKLPDVMITLNIKKAQIYLK